MIHHHKYILIADSTLGRQQILKHMVQMVKILRQGDINDQDLRH